MLNYLFPGSFDPFTEGHKDIVRRASLLCDKLYVAVMINPSKKTAFTPDERVDMIKRCVKDLPNVEVIQYDGLQVELYKELNCNAVIRGIRNDTDYRYESDALSANSFLYEDYEAIFLPCNSKCSIVSSSLVKEVFAYGGDISKMVPREIIDCVIDKLKKGKV